MKFDPSTLQALKDFVIDLLRSCPGNSAEEDILADYVIALLKYEKSTSELRQLCETQLEDFLKEETLPFVSKLFKSLTSKDYLQPRTRNSLPQEVRRQPQASEHRDERPVEDHKEERAVSRDDLADYPAEPFAEKVDVLPEDREYKPDAVVDRRGEQQDRKAQKRYRPEDPTPEEHVRANKAPRPIGPSSTTFTQMAPPPRPLHASPATPHRRIDPQPGCFFGLQGTESGSGPPIHRSWQPMPPNMATPIPVAMHNPGTMPMMITNRHREPGSGGRRHRCRDFEERGFCMRGEACPFEHGRGDEDAMSCNSQYHNVPVPHLQGIPTGPMRPPFLPPMGGPPLEAMMAGMAHPAMNGAIPPQIRERMAMAQVLPLPTPMTADGGISHSPMSMAVTRGGTFRGRGRGRGRGGSSFGGRASFHANKGFTLVVENIPEESCTLDCVNNFFKKFGTVTNIQVDRHNLKALVQFSNNAEAYKAHTSPEPIFGNRFVRVYWFEKDTPEGTAAGEGGGPAVVGGMAAPANAGATGASPSALAAANAAHLAEVNAVREMKAKARKEQLSKALELQRGQEAMLQKQIEEQKRMLAEISKDPSISAREKEELMRRIDSVASAVSPAGASAGSPTGSMPTISPLAAHKSLKYDALKMAEHKERERLDRELDMLSRVHDKKEEGSSEFTAALQARLDQLKAEAASLGVHEPSHRGRGGVFRGRARGRIARGRGGFRTYNLDLRPTKLLLKGAPESVRPDLKRHFERYGTVVSVTTDEATGDTVVHYGTRQEAEKAYLNAGKFEDIPGRLPISWYTDPAAQSSSVPRGDTNADSHAPRAGLGSNSGMSQMVVESEEDEDDDERNWKRDI